MSFLVHAILGTEDAHRVGEQTGWDGWPLEVVSAGTLAAACSRVPAVCTHPEVRQLLDHARIVNELFQRVTLLPMRFGCWLDGPAQLDDLLRRNEATYRAGLQQVDGCVELGIRVLLAENGRQDPGTPDRHSPSPGALPAAPRDATAAVPPAGTRLGASYLLARKAGYEHRDRHNEAWQRVRGSLERAMAGLFVKSAAEQCSTSRQRFGSVYFLVARPDCARFRAAYDDLERARPERLLLTGPWPPYNFMASQPPGLES